MTDYIHEPALVADSATFQRAANASVMVYDADDTFNASPLELNDLNGLPLSNPVTSTSDAFTPWIVTTSAQLKLVGGGLTVVISSYKGLREDALAAQAEAQEAKAAALGAQTAAEAAAAAAAEAAAEALADAVGDAEAAKSAAQDAAALVGAPADTAISTAINAPGSATRTALNATIGATATEKWKPGTNYFIGDVRQHPNGDVRVSTTNHVSGASPGTLNWADAPALATEVSNRKRDLERQRRQRVITRPRAAKVANLPGALGWTPPSGFALFTDGVKYFTKYDAASRKVTGGTTRYVHTSSGNDVTGTGAEGAPYQTLAKAHTVAADGDTIIFLDQGIAYKNLLNADATMYKALNIMAAYPDKFMAAAADNLTYTPTAGQPNVYETTRTNVQRVVDLLVDPTGFRYTNVASPAACSALPGSWHQAGATLHVHTIDGSAPVSSRILALVSVRLFEFGAAARSSDGALYLEGLRVLNGTQGIKVTGGVYDIGFTAKGCQFLHGHFSGADGVQLFDVGSSVIQDTLVAHTGKDGFNYHQAGRVTHFLEIGAEAHSIGLDRGSDYTMNGSTAHDGIKGARIGGRYHYVNGTPVADVHVGTKTANFSCDSWDSLAPFGSGYSAGFATQQAGAEMWNFRTRSWGTESDLYYVTGSTMHVDDLTEFDTKNGGGTLDIVSAA